MPGGRKVKVKDPSSSKCCWICTRNLEKLWISPFIKQFLPWWWNCDWAINTKRQDKNIDDDALDLNENVNTESIDARNTENANTARKDNISDDDGLDLNENAFLVLCGLVKMHCLRGINPSIGIFIEYSFSSDTHQISVFLKHLSHNFSITQYYE